MFLGKPAENYLQIAGMRERDWRVRKAKQDDNLKNICVSSQVFCMEL